MGGGLWGRDLACLPYNVDLLVETSQLRVGSLCYSISLLIGMSFLIWVTKDRICRANAVCLPR